MTTTPTPEAVERFNLMHGAMTRADMGGDWVRFSNYYAHVDALTKERDEARADAEFMTENRNKWQDATTRARRERDAALAASGAVAEATRKQDVAHVKHWWRELDDSGPVWEYLEDQPMVQTDAAAALAEHDRAIREDERKACAEVARSRYLAWHQGCPVECDATACEDIADAILARKEDTGHDHR